MAKNLKLNIKNTQLAEAFKLGASKAKTKVGSKKAPAKKAAASPEEEKKAPSKAGTLIKKSANTTEAAKKAAPAKKPAAKATPKSSSKPLVKATKVEPEIVPAKLGPKKTGKRLGPKPKKEEESEASVEEQALPEESQTEVEAATDSDGEAAMVQRSKPAPHEQRSQEILDAFKERSAGKKRPRLGPTGRHVNDLMPKKVEKPAAKRPGQAQVKPAPAAEAASTDSRSDRKSHKKGSSFDKAAGKNFNDLRGFKKAPVRGFDSRDRQGLRVGEEERWRKRRVKKQRVEAMPQVPESITIRTPITIKDLASEMKLKASQLMSKLLMQGVMCTLNDALDDETTLGLLGEEFNCQINIDSSEERRIRVTEHSVAEEIAAENPEELEPRAPVVAFMGHVDHGKTSLIDSIRKTNRTAHEAGAITQHIGAFSCQTSHGPVTILDTPGHEAFTEMRERGALVTDIVVLVVAGDDGVKDQTIEAIRQAKEAKATILVAINKCDKAGFDVDNVYRQLAEQELLPEAWGGSTVTVKCSAIKGEGVKELLEMLSLQAEVLELKANPNHRARGTVIEAELHKGLGPVATLLVQNGSLKKGDALVFDFESGRVKNMQNEHGKEIDSAGPSMPVCITGLTGMPTAGQEFIVVSDEKEARAIAQMRREARDQSSMNRKLMTAESLLEINPKEKKIRFPVILKADVQGSLEALKVALEKIESSKIEVNVVSASVGEISESDVELASASGATIVGFHTNIESHAEPYIRELKVKVELFSVIYHAVDAVKKIMKDQLAPIIEEHDRAKLTVKAVFKSSQYGLIAGCQVEDGVINRNSHLRVMRDGEQVWKGGVASLRRGKDDVKEVKQGLECGVLFNGFKEVQEGDVLEAFDRVAVEQEL